MLLESDFKGDWEVFMVGQGDALVEQTEEEVAQAAETEIARAEKLARNIEKVVEKRNTSPHNRHDGLAVLNEDSRDGAAPRGHHPKFD
jgi:NADH dehydrogenase FAD-containing subunit